MAGQAVSVFGAEEKATTWLLRPNRALNGGTVCEYGMPSSPQRAPDRIAAHISPDAFLQILRAAQLDVDLVYKLWQP